MSRRKNFKGLKEKGKKAYPIWSAFSFIGYIMVFFTCLVGGTLLTNSLFFGGVIALFFFLCLFFISQFLETAREAGNSQVLLWIAYAFVSIMATTVGYHYLHNFHSEKATFMNSQEAVLKDKVNLLKDYSVLTTQMSKLDNCNTSTLREDAEILQDDLNYYVEKSSKLRNPFSFLFNVGNKSQEKSFEDIKRDITASINKYKRLNKGSCENIQLPASLSSESDESVISIVEGNTLSSSLADANWLLFLGLLLITSFLILAPYFIGDPAKTILKLQ